MNMGRKKPTILRATPARLTTTRMREDDKDDSIAMTCSLSLFPPILSWMFLCLHICVIPEVPGAGASHRPRATPSIARRHAVDCHPEPIRFAQGKLREGSDSPSLPDSCGVVPRLAPARAPPPSNPTPCHYMLSTLLPRRRAVAWWRGGSPTCSGTGWSGGAVGPLRVPGPTARRSMHACPTTVRERADSPGTEILRCAQDDMIGWEGRPSRSPWTLS